MGSVLAMDMAESASCNRIVQIYTSVGVVRIPVAIIVSTAVRDIS